MKSHDAIEINLTLHDIASLLIGETVTIREGYKSIIIRQGESADARYRDAIEKIRRVSVHE